MVSRSPIGLVSPLTCAQIRGEFMRASRVFSARPERAILALAQLCEERKDDEIVQPDSSNQTSPFIPPRTSPVPTQTPYPVGSNPARLNADATPHVPQFARNLAHQQQTVPQRLPTLPEHATANHPAETPNVIRSAYAGGPDRAYPPNAVHGVSNDASSDTSDIITDDEMMEAFLDSVDDVRSYMDESPEFTRASSPASSQASASLPIPPDTDDIPKSPSQVLLDNHFADVSGSKPNNSPLRPEPAPFPLIRLEPPQPAHVIPSRIDTVKRVTSELASFSALTIPFGYNYSSSSSCAYFHRQSASPLPSPHISNPGIQRQQQSSQCPSPHQPPQTVFYETTGPTPFKHSNHINHLSHGNNGESTITHPHHHAYYLASHSHLQLEQPPQHQRPYEGSIPGSSRQSVFGAGGESMSVKNLPQHVLSARKRNSRRGSISDGSSGRMSWREASGSTNGNTRSNTPTTSSMTPPQHPRSLSREGSNLSRPSSRTKHSHSNSSVTVKPGTKQHQHGGHGQGVHQQQTHRLRNGSVPSSPIVYQDPSSPFSSPLQPQHQPPSPSTSKPHLRKDPRNSPFSGTHLNSPRRGSSGQLSHPQGDVSFNNEVSDVAYISRTTGSPCASVSNGSATTGSAIDSSPGSISSTSSSLQSAFNRSMTDNSGFEVVSPLQSRIGRLPSSQHGCIVRRNVDGGASEGYRMLRQNLQDLRVQKEQGGMEDWQTFHGGRGDHVCVQQGGDGQAQLESEESTRRIRHAWKEYQARRVEGNGVVYHQQQMGMTVDLEGRKVLAVGDKHGKKW